ncbi:hypothetical protein ON010_g6610 [Phytophthora cinnamomi]|nr:hypothetical protein ON010_g6610 [Phytophthora cinnamomi]
MNPSLDTHGRGKRLGDIHVGTDDTRGRGRSGGGGRVRAATHAGRVLLDVVVDGVRVQVHALLDDNVAVAHQHNGEDGLWEYRNEFMKNEHEEGEDGAGLVRVHVGVLVALGALNAGQVRGSRKDDREREHLQRHHEHDADEETHCQRRLVLAHDHGASNRERDDKHHGPDAHKAQRFRVALAFAVVVDSGHDCGDRVHEAEQHGAEPEVRDEHLGVVDALARLVTRVFHGGRHLKGAATDEVSAQQAGNTHKFVGSTYLAGCCRGAKDCAGRSVLLLEAELGNERRGEAGTRSLSWFRLSTPRH